MCWCRSGDGKMDPFTQYPTLSLIANVYDPITRDRTRAIRAHHPQGGEVPQVDGPG